VNKKKEELSKLRTGLFSRGLSLAKAGLRAGSLATSQLLSDDPEKTKQRLFKTVEALATEMGQLKGSAMKVGQLLSTYGENFLPKEVNDILKTLQQKSPPLTWAKIEPRLKDELKNQMSSLDIEKVALASASIGQVHLAKRKSDGLLLAIKVQYPGVQGAIDTDLKFLKVMLSLTSFVPRGPRFDQVFDEVRDMLYQEVDYRKELSFTKKFRELLYADSKFVIPTPIEDLCTPKLMVTTFESGVTPDSLEALTLPLERRNRLGKAFLELYLRELLEFGLMQTDPHLGNYRIRIQPDGNDQLVLFDFGAVRTVSREFQQNYLWLMRGVHDQNPEFIERGGRAIGLLQPNDSPELIAKYVELCLLIGEPFSEQHSQDYDFGNSDLPRRVAKAGSELALNFKLRAPPAELVFLDRKLGGVFVFLTVLKCKMSGREMLADMINRFAKN
jgi:predicted unusual protein kinase regulating ubiquinone biosynthesis (AarF/ABC1/UbiB family)